MRYFPRKKAERLVRDESSGGSREGTKERKALRENEQALRKGAVGGRPRRRQADASIGDYQ